MINVSEESSDCRLFHNDSSSGKEHKYRSEKDFFGTVKMDLLSIAATAWPVAYLSMHRFEASALDPLKGSPARSSRAKDRGDIGKNIQENIS